MLSLILAISDPVKRDLILDLYQNYQDKCLAIAFHIVHNQQAAEDILQDVFEKLVKDPDMLEYDTVQKNWAYISIIIKNACINYVRNNKKLVFVGDFDDNAEGVPSPAYDVDFAELLATQERFARVVEAIMNLPNIYKDAILLRYGYDLSNQQISACLGISIDNVYARISRAAKKVQEEINEQDAGDVDG